MSLDKKDLQLLAELDVDARQTYLQLGRKLRMNKDTVKYRMGRLEEKGIIQGYYTQIDAQKLGYTAYRVYLKLENLALDTRKEIISWLKERPETFFVVDVFGIWDIAVLFWARDIGLAEEFWICFREKYRPYVQEYKLSVFAKLHIFPRKYLGSKPDVRVTQSNLIELDKKYFVLLDALAQNARAGYVELAQRLDMSAKVIAYRLQQLERKKVILGYRAKTNYGALGYQYYKVDINLNTLDKMRGLHEFARVHPNIIFINQTIGAADFEFDVEIESFDALIALIDEIRTKFPGLVRDVSYFQVSNVHKISYMPRL